MGRQRLLFKRRQGVPIGFKHNWYYAGGRWREKKINRRDWVFRYKSPKSRSGGRGGPPPGYRVMWGINAIQRAVKVSPRKYKTEMVGKKRILGYYDPRKRRWVRVRRNN